MNSISEYVSKLSYFIPEFSERWNSDDCLFNDGNESTIHCVFAEFSHLVIEQLKNGSLKNKAELFSFIESVALKDNDDSNAVFTCFLENIANRFGESINSDSVMPFLGKASKKFVIANYA